MRSEIFIPMFQDLIKACDEFEHEGSGWRLKTYSRLEIIINVGNPLRVGSCCKNEHLLPLNLAKKHALLQVVYKDELHDFHCFKWSIYSAIYSWFHPLVGPNIDIEVLQSFMVNNGISIDFSMIKEWPVSVFYDRAHPEMNVFRKFEEINGISLNMYTVDGCYVDKQSVHGNMDKSINQVC